MLNNPNLRVPRVSSCDIGHLDFLTGLRGLAASFVMLSHVWYEIWPAVAPPYGYGRRPEGATAWLTGWMYYGHFGVVVFIVLSGLCLMLPVLANDGHLRGGSYGFLIRRAWRILPPYYGAMALTMLLIWFWIGEKTGAQWDISIPVAWSGFLSHLFMLQDLAEATQINYVFWSIAVEVHLYLTFPALVWLWRQFGATRTLAAACAIVYGLIALLEVLEYQDIPPHFIGLCAYFVLGMAAADLLVRVRNRQGGLPAPWAALAFVLGTAVVALCAAWGQEIAERRFALLDTICALAVVALILAAGCPKSSNRVRGLLEHRAAVGLGVFSYSLYLIHAPILHLIWQYAVAPWASGETVQFVWLLALGTPASLAVAYLFFTAVERPFLAVSARLGGNYAVEIADNAPTK